MFFQHFKNQKSNNTNYRRRRGVGVLSKICCCCCKKISFFATPVSTSGDFFFPNQLQQTQNYCVLYIIKYIYIINYHVRYHEVNISMTSHKSRLEELEQFRKAFKSDHPYIETAYCGPCKDGSITPDSEVSDESEVEDYQHDSRYLFIHPLSVSFIL
jgi:hypothetical protein